MFTRTIFRLAIWLILLLPAGLLILGWHQTNRRDPESEEDQTSELNLARIFAWVAAAMPGLFILRALIPGLKMTAFLTVGGLLTGTLFGLASIPLFLISARGTERLTGPLSGLVSAPLSLLLLFSGGAVA